jgi:hypothetical protein
MEKSKISDRTGEVGHKLIQDLSKKYVSIQKSIDVVAAKIVSLKQLEGYKNDGCVNRLDELTRAVKKNTGYANSCISTMKEILKIKE